MMIDKGTYVRIRRTLLKSEERSPNLPKETSLVPLKMWVKGYLQDDADLFDTVTVETITGRFETGRLKEVNPPYRHGYGDFVPEILKLGDIIQNDMYGDCDEQ